jgi:hypothetical protein
MLEWSGIPYVEMIEHLITAALQRHRRRSATRI